MRCSGGKLALSKAPTGAFHWPTVARLHYPNASAEHSYPRTITNSIHSRRSASARLLSSDNEGGFNSGRPLNIRLAGNSARAINYNYKPGPLSKERGQACKLQFLFHFLIGLFDSEPPYPPQVDYAANFTATDTPAFAHKPTRESSESLSTLLRAISEIRGCTTPRRLAASA